MDIRKLQRAIVDGLEDVKGNDIVVFNTEHLTPLFERVIIASGNSNRQTKALASSVRETVKKRGLEVLRTEGEANGEWIIVDCGAAVAHIMQPGIREYYRLEEIWGEKAVRMKLAGKAGGGLPKAAAAPAEATAKADAAARKAPPARAASAKAPDKKASDKKAAARKAAARKAPAPRVAARKGAAATTSSAKAAPPRAGARAGAVRAAAGARPAVRKAGAR